MAEIQELSIKVTAEGVVDSTKQIKDLTKTLKKLGTEVTKVSSSLANINFSGFTYLTKACKDISNIDSTGIKDLADALKTISKINISKIQNNISKMKNGVGINNEEMLDGKTPTANYKEPLLIGDNISRPFAEMVYEVQNVTQNGLVPLEKELDVIDVKFRVIKDAFEEAFPRKSVENAQNVLHLLKAGAVNSLKNKVEKLKKSFNGLLKTFGRIMLYRAVRSVIKGLASSIKEGVDNLYQWSKAQKDVLGNNFSESMDRISTSFNYLKNSAGAMVSPLINALAPAIEKVTDLLVKLLNVLNQVFSVLSGSKTWTKAIKKTKEYAAAVNKAKGSLAGFDELNNIGNSSSGSSNEGVYDFEINGIDENRIFAIKSAIAGIGVALAGLKLLELGKWLTKFSPELGKIASTLGGIALVIGGVTIMFSGLIDAFENGFNVINVATTIIGGVIAGVGVGIIAGFTGVQLAIAGIVGAIVGIIGLLGVLYLRHEDEIKAFVNKISGILDNAIEWVHENITTRFGVIGEFVGTFLEKAISIVKMTIQNVNTLLSGFFNGIKQIVQGIVQIFKGDLKGGINTALQGIKTIVVSIANVIWNTVRTLVNNVVRGVENGINSVVSGINALLSPLRSAGNWVLKKLGVSGNIPSFSYVSLPRLDVGTNYVPEDQLAMIHKGEAVIPKEFNSKEYFGGSNDETNDLLRELISVVIDKDMNAYIDGDSIGKASVKYINKQSRLKGASVI